MSIEILTNYLQYNRRAEDAEAKSKYRLAQVIDKLYNPNVPLHEEDVLLVNKEEIKQESGFKNISNIVVGNLYFTIAPNNQYQYYIKKEIEQHGTTINQYARITSIVSNTWETLNENDLYEVVFKESSPILYFSEVLFKIIILFLDDIYIFGDTIKYHPNDISEVTNGEYTLDYKDANGFTKGLWDTILKGLGNSNQEYLIAEAKRKLFLTKNSRPGLIHLFPRVFQNQNKYYLQYRYYAKGIPQQSFILDTALTLEFNYIGAMMAFLNQTIFYSLNELSHFEGSKNRETFIISYRNIIEGHIYDINSTQMLEVLYFTPSFLVKEIRSEYLWLIIDGLLTGRISNFDGLDHEDIVLKLLEALSQKQGLENKILEQLLTKHPSGKTRLELLSNGMDGTNFVILVKLISSIWKNSRFIIPNLEINPEFKTTTGPLFLPYTSEKWLGFYFSNTTISFENNASELMLKVLYETGKFKKEMRPGLKTDNLVSTQVPIIDQFFYHPFYPIYIKNLEKQETSIKLDAVVPAFILKANEEKQFWHNVVKTGEYTIDALTLLSGVGNLYKFRNLAKLAEAGETLSFWSKAEKVVTGTAAVIEISSGSLNAMFKLTGFEDTELGKSLQEYLFWLEMLSLSGELIVAIHKGLQKCAREIVADAEKSAKLEKELDKLVEEGKITRKEADDLVKSLEKHSGNFKIDNFIARNGGKAIKELNKKTIIQELKGATETATEVAEAIDKGEIKMIKLSKEDLIVKVKEVDPNCKNPEEVLATQFKKEIYVLENRGVDYALGEIVHEGKHALDFNKGFFDNPHLMREETKVMVYDKYPLQRAVEKMTDKQVIELRGRIAEREFQKAAKVKLDFSSVPELISFINLKY